MTSKVRAAPPFRKQLRRLGRKYPSAPDEVDSLINLLERDERPGDKIPDVGYDVYKVRLANPSAGCGKSGGFRVICYLRRDDDVLLLSIYSKFQYANITPEEIRQIIEAYGGE